MWNPNSAFPRQSVYIPQPSGYGPQRAVNSPNFGDAGPAGNYGAPNSAAAFRSMNAEALSRASGAGISGGVANLYNRQPIVQAMQQSGSRRSPGHGRTRMPQPANQGIPQSAAMDQVDQMATDIIQSSKTPLSVPIVRGGPHRGGVLLGGTKDDLPF